MAAAVAKLYVEQREKMGFPLCKQLKGQLEVRWQKTLTEQVFQKDFFK